MRATFRHTSDWFDSPAELAAYRFSDVDLTPRRPAPLLGEHNREIFRDLLGYPEAEIRRLEDEGVLHQERAVEDKR